MRKCHIVVAALMAAACNQADEPSGADGNSAEMQAGSGSAKEQQPPASVSQATDATVQPTNAGGYVAMAGAADLWEIESSKAILDKTRNPEIKRFAQMMIDHHSKSTEKLKAAAKAANMTVTTPTLAADQQGMLKEIQDAPAADADAIYLRHQRAAHGKALALHQGFATNGDNAELRKAAAEIVPVVKQHMTEIDQISRKVPASGG